MPLQQPEGVKVTSLYYEVVSNGRVDFPAGAPIGRLQNSCPRDKFAQPFPGRTRKRVPRKRLVDEPMQTCSAAFSLPETLDKLDHYTRLAQQQGAQLAVFPEAL